MNFFVSVVLKKIILILVVAFSVSAWGTSSDRYHGNNNGYAHHDDHSGYFDASRNRWEWKGPHKGCHVKGKHYHHYHGGHGHSQGELDCSKAKAVPRVLWPANHRFAPVDIGGMRTSDGTAPVVTVQCVFQDEPINGVGDGNTNVDAKLFPDGQLKLRKERAGRRSGNGNGRVYHIDFEALDEAAGESCTGSVAVEVPHRWWGKARDDGRLYVSLDNGYNCGGSSNQPPEITSTPVTTAMELTLYEYAVSASDPEGATLGYRLLEAPAAMTISADGLIQWSPDQGEAGSYLISLEVNDGDNTVEQSFTLTVSTRDNTPPVITSTPLLDATEEQPYEYQVIALDNENDSFGFSLASGPAGLSVSLDGLVQWTPNDGQAGDYPVSIEVIDALGAVATQSYTISVAAKPNNAPEILSAPITTVNENSVYEYTVLATDPEGSALTYSLTTGPDSLTLTGNLLAWATTFEDAGEYPVEVQVEDAEGATASQSFLLTVADVNRAPLFTSVPSLVVAENGLYEYTPEASDEDGDTVTLELVSGPEGMLLNAEGVVEWMPTYDDAGLYDVEFTANDGRGGSTLDQFQLTVTNTNRDPQITSTPIEVAAENTLYSYQVEASDDDEQTIVYSLTESPESMTISDEGLIEWVPGFEDAGDIAVEVAVTDSEITISQSFVIVVANTNQLPVAVDQAITIAEDTATTITLVANDGDADALTYATSTQPMHGTLVLNNNQVDYTPNPNFFGTDSFTFIASDAEGDSQPATVSITITSVNDAPAISFTPALTGQENIAYSADVDATDVEGDLLLFSLITAPTGMAIDAATGAITWLPGFDQAGDNLVTVSVSDASGASATFSFTIVVTNTNQAPLANNISVQTDEDQAASIELDGSDSDGDAIAYTVLNQPVNGSLSGIAPTLSYVPNANFNGADSLTYKVNDGSADSSVATVSITVNPVNDAPEVQPIAVTMFGDSSEDITLLGSDIDGDALSFAITTDPANGSVVVEGHTATYTPNIGFVGSDSFVFVVNDGTVNSMPESVTITVSAPNNPPEITSEPANVGLEGELYSYKVIADDSDGDTITYSLEVSPAGMVIDGLTGDISWIDPIAGEHSVAVEAADGRGGVTTQNYVLFIAEVLPPVTSSGTDFWLAFAANLDNQNRREIYISSKVDTIATVEIPSSAFMQSYSVVANEVLTIELTGLVQDARFTAGSNNAIENIGVHVNSDDQVSVFYLNHSRFSTDAAIVFPTLALGARYQTASYGGPAFSWSLFGILATEDNTTVTIRPGERHSYFNAPVSRGEEYQVVLNRGEFYQALLGSGDTSGTEIISDQPVAAYSGNWCTFVQTQACDHVIEQLVPIDSLGASFMTLPLASRFLGDTFTVYAVEDDSYISINGEIETYLDKGESYTKIIEEPSLIESNRPLQVMQFSNGEQYDDFVDGVFDDFGDPFMLAVPAEEQYISQYMFTTPATGYALNFVNVISRDRSRHAVTIDGNTIDETDWQEIPGTDYVGAQIAIDLGSHVASSIEPFGLYVYGFEEFVSYGYLGGAAFSSGEPVVNISLQAESLAPLLGEEVCVEAFATSVGANPVAQVRVEFTVDHQALGVLREYSGLTDASGYVELCFERGGLGQDIVVARADGQSSAPLAIDWQPGSGGENLAPVFVSLPTPKAFGGEIYQYLPVVQDAENDALSFTIATTLVDQGLSIDGTSGLITWAAPEDITPRDHFSITITVTDTAGNTALQAYNLVGDQPPTAPTISHDPIDLGLQGRSQAITVEATDPNYDEQLTWSLAQGGASDAINFATGLLTRTVDVQYPGFPLDLNTYCREAESNLASIDFQQLWSQPNIVSQGIVGPLYDSNTDGVLDQFDRKALIAKNSSRSVVALDAVTGELIWTSSETVSSRHNSVGALVNLDGDTDVEYVYPSENTRQLVALNSDGTTRWVTAEVYSIDIALHNAVYPVDLDSDGKFEILFGPSVFDANGNLLWRFPQRPTIPSSAAPSGMAMPVDIDGDGYKEVIYYNEVRDWQGNLLWNLPNVVPGTLSETHFAAANVDLDPEKEVFVNARYGGSNYRLQLVDHDGTLVWDLPTMSLSQILAADVDNDGVTEIYSPGSRSMYRADGSVLWSHNDSNQKSGATLVDLDADGILDVAQYVNDALYVYRGDTGELSFKLDFRRPNSTLRQLPQVGPTFVDVDGDGRGELITSARADLRVFSGVKDDWQAGAFARAFLNQHFEHFNPGYAEPIVEGSIFGQSSAAAAALSHGAVRLADIVVRGVRANPVGSVWQVEVQVANRGLVHVPAGEIIEIFKNDTSDPANKLGEVSLPALEVEGGVVAATLDVGFVDLGGELIARLSSESEIVECKTDNNIASSNTVSVSVTDISGLSDQETWSIGATVFEERPTISTTPIQVATVGQEYIYTIQATSPYGSDEIRYEINTGLPAGASLNTVTGELTWTPNIAQAGRQNFALFANDHKGNVASQSFFVDVGIGVAVNQPPLFTSTPGLGAVPGFMYRYPVVASDPDGDYLSYSLTEAPAGMLINRLTGLISWIPEAAQLDDVYSVTVEVADPLGALASQSFSVTVGENNFPEITSLPSTVSTVGLAYEYQVIASDADGDDLTYSLPISPAGMSISSDGLVVWNTASALVGTYSVEIAVSDGIATVTQSFSIEVMEDNGGGTGGEGSLRLSAVPKTVAFVDDAFSFFATGVSDEPGPVSIALVSAPEGMTITSGQPFVGFYQIDWLPDEANCQHDVTLLLTDSAGNTEQVTFTIDVYSAPKRLNRFQCAVDAEFCPTR